MAKQRFIHVILLGLGILPAGVLYSLFVNMTSIGIPCVFRLVTGLQCPGCGITHMFMSLLRLDIGAAFAAHQMLFVQLPVLAVMLIKNLVQYIRIGSRQLSRFDTIVLYVCAVLLLIFAIYRNVVAMEVFCE